MSAVRLSPDSLGEYQAALREAGVDGWLFYDFRGTNPVAGELTGVGGFVTRRWFVWVPLRGAPVAITHAIEQGVWSKWPAGWGKVVYSSWPSLEQHVGALVSGQAHRDGVFRWWRGAVPRSHSGRHAGDGHGDRRDDRLVRRPGVAVLRAVEQATTSTSHRRAAAVVAEVARDAFRFAGERARVGTPGARIRGAGPDRLGVQPGGTPVQPSA